MKLFWTLFGAVVFCLLILLADGYISRYGCPQMDNSAVYDEDGKMICKNGRPV